MTTQRKGIPYLKVFGDWLTRFQKLDDAQFGRLVRAAVWYVCAGEEPTIDGIEGYLFDTIRPALDMDIARYREKVEKNTENGAKGAATRWGSDSERHTEDSERHSLDGENSQEKERREKREEKREKKEDTRGGYRGDKSDDKRAALQEAWRNFNAMRNRKGQPVSSIDMKGIQTRLKEYGGDDIEKHTKMLNAAAEKEWMTVYPLKEDGELSEPPADNLINGTTAKSIISHIAAGCSL